MFMASPSSLPTSGDPDREIVDLTGDDDDGGDEYIHAEYERRIEPASRPRPITPAEEAPPEALPRKKRKSAKREQMERAFKEYLNSLDPTQRSVVLRGFAKMSEQKDSLLRMRQQLKSEIQPDTFRPELARNLSTVEAALCEIDELLVGIRQGSIPVLDVPSIARTATNKANGVRSRLDAEGRDQAMRVLQDQAASNGHLQMLNDPAYIDARSRSLVTPLANTTSSGYLPAVNPESANQLAYQTALTNPTNPGWLPDGRYIRPVNLPFFNEPPGFNSNGSERLDPSTEALVDLAKNDAQPLEMPHELNCASLEHQKQGLGWLVRAEHGRNKGSILADDMGLGKTMQTIALMYENPPSQTQDPSIKQILIVCPVALIQTWSDELRNRVKEQYRMKVYIHHRGSNDTRLFTRASEIRARADVVICTYHAVTNEYKQLMREQEQQTAGPHPLFDMRWHRVVLDEAHAIKNRNAQVSIACSHLKARYRLALTGTPMQNRIEELFPLVRFLRIAPYGESWGEFKALVPMTHDVGKPRFESQKALAAFLSAIMLRRVKDTVIKGRKIIDNLPAKHMKDVYVEMSGGELENYKLLEESVGNELQRLSSMEEQLTYNNMLVMLLRMRQTACHPLLVTITKKSRSGRTWGDNVHTKSEVNLALHIESHVAEYALSTNDDDRLCVVCGGPAAVLHETYIFSTCGDVLCTECASQQRPELENQVSDNGEIGGVRCPRCEAQSYYIANLEIIKIIQEYPDLTSLQYVELLIACQQPRVEQHQISEENRKRRLDELRYDENSLVNLLMDSDDEGLAVDSKPSLSADGNPSPADSIEYKINIDELAKLFYVRDIFTNGWVTSTKIEACLDVLREIWQEAPNDKVIIFSSFTSLLDIMTIPLEAARVQFLQYTGKMDAPSRNDVLKQFREGACRLLLTSMKAGNVGLTLTQANRVIILEPFWNPYVEEQAQDRVYRIGQSREVTVYRIRLRNTVEDRIIGLQDKKRETIEAALDPSMKTQAQGLSRSDLLFALGLNSGRNASTQVPSVPTTQQGTMH